MSVAAPRHRDGCRAGCAPSGLALHLREHQGCRRCAQVFGDEEPWCPGSPSTLKGAGRTSICSSMSFARTGIGDGRRDARGTLDPTPVAYLDRRRLRERIHGRPRSNRKKRFLLSAVAPSTITRYPREAKPINWAQRGGLASGGKLCPDAEATFSPRHHARLVTRWLVLRTALLFVRRAVRLVCAVLPKPGSGLLAEASTLRAG